MTGLWRLDRGGLSRVKACNYNDNDESKRQTILNGESRKRETSFGNGENNYIKTNDMD